MPGSGALSITWLGHSTFLLTSPGGKRLLFDPWLKDNPSCPLDRKTIRACDLILISHAHPDHMGDAVSVARATGALVVTPYELGVWLEQKGLQRIKSLNIGGSIELLGLKITMVHAEHSSSHLEDGRLVFLGPSVGYVVRFENELTIYFAGDTGLFGDMRTIGEIYNPDIAFLPIGDRFTMGPDGAARACEWLRVRQVVPMHYGTFPDLTGTPAALRALVEPRNVQVLELKPGETAT
jgi:L-ascorbate metabolism protein UlaG (beta-lactamase superfamily)